MIIGQEDITLELLIKQGNPEGVEKFAGTKGYNNKKKEEKKAEAGIYYAIREMWKQAEGGIDSDSVCRFFNQDIFKNYFSSTANIILLEDLIDVLDAGTHAQMETYAQITAIDVFGMDLISDAIRKNLDNGKIKEKTEKLVKNGYSLVFCTFDIDSEQVNNYFPLVDKWRDLINPKELVEETIESFAEEIKEKEMDFDYQKEFLDAALDKLIELTDKQTVSNLIYDKFEEGFYKKLVKEGKIDEYDSSLDKAKPEEVDAEGIPRKIVSAVEKYENKMGVWDLDVTHLEEVVNGKAKKYISKKMGEWFRKGKLRQVLEIVKYKNQDLYDHEIARKEISKGIEEAVKKGNLIRLGWVMDFPEYLIDRKNPAITSVIEAYDINKETKSKQPQTRNRLS